MITKEKMLWSFTKFFQLILKGSVWRSVWRICIWILGLKGLRFEQWLIVGGFWSDVFTTITTTTTITVIYLTTLSSKSTSVHSKIGTFIKSTITIIMSSIYIKNYLTIIPQARMGSESIAHEAKGRMGYWLRGHEGERNNCFSKIQLVGQKYRDKTTLASKTRFSRHCFGFQSRRFSLLVGYNI